MIPHQGQFKLEASCIRVTQATVKATIGLRDTQSRVLMRRLVIARSGALVLQIELFMFYLLQKELTDDQVIPCRISEILWHDRLA